MDQAAPPTQQGAAAGAEGQDAPQTAALSGSVHQTAGPPQTAQQQQPGAESTPSGSDKLRVAALPLPAEQQPGAAGPPNAQPLTGSSSAAAAAGAAALAPPGTAGAAAAATAAAGAVTPASAAAAPAGPAQNPLVTAMIAREDGASTALEALEEIVERAAAVIYQHYLGKKVVPFAVDVCMRDLDEVLRCHFVTHDQGEPGDSLAQSWLADEEPVPPPIDNWARRVLPVREAPARTASQQGAAAATAAASASSLPSGQQQQQAASAQGQAQPDKSDQQQQLQQPPAGAAAAAVAQQQAPPRTGMSSAASSVDDTFRSREREAPVQQRESMSSLGSSAQRRGSKKPHGKQHDQQQQQQQGRAQHQQHGSHHGDTEEERRERAASAAADEKSPPSARAKPEKSALRRQRSAEGRIQQHEPAAASADDEQRQGQAQYEAGVADAVPRSSSAEAAVDSGADQGSPSAAERAEAAAREKPQSAATREEMEARQAKRVKIRSAPAEKHKATARQKAAAEQAAAEKEKEREKQLAQRTRGMRGKEFTFTHTGEIVMINPLPPDKLPTNAAYVRAVVVEDAAESAAQAKAQGEKAPGSPDTSPRRKRFERSVDPRRQQQGQGQGQQGGSMLGADGLFFVPDPKLTSAPLIDTIKLAPGVTVREGARVKSSVPALPRAMPAQGTSPQPRGPISPERSMDSTPTLPPIDLPQQAAQGGRASRGSQLGASGDKVRAMVTLEYLTS